MMNVNNVRLVDPPLGAEGRRSARSAFRSTCRSASWSGWQIGFRRSPSCVSRLDSFAEDGRTTWSRSSGGGLAFLGLLARGSRDDDAMVGGKKHRRRRRTAAGVAW